jgi:hypothetical protein
MKRFLILFSIACFLIPLSGFAQKNKKKSDIDVVKILETAENIKERPKKNISDSIIDNLKAIRMFKDVLPFLHEDEKICNTLFSLADAYIDLGLNEAYYVDNIRKFEEYVSDKDDLVYFWNTEKRSGHYVLSDRTPLFWKMSQKYLNIILSLANEQEDINSANELLEYINENEREYRQIVYKQQSLTFDKFKLLEQEKEIRKQKREHSPFFQIGAGCGATFGSIGAQASFYKSPNGWCIIGGIGEDKTEFMAGLGFGFANTYSTNIHCNILYGNHKFSKKGDYIASLGLFLNLNIDVYKELGVNIDGGLWTAGENATRWGWSLGVYYKFSFASLKKKLKK